VTGSPAAMHTMAAVMTTVPATGVLRLAWLMLAFPLFGAAVLIFGGRRTDRWGHLLGVATPIASFVYGVIAFAALLGYPAAERSRNVHLYSWIPVAGFHVNAGLLLDPLSMVFVLLVTGVGSLIHIYSVGYMAHDPDRRRFFGYLNLFIAAMLLLVLSNNYLTLYVGWEGVGLASYLLIGFWQFKPSAAVAAKKAFIVNRVGDAGFTIAIFLMFATFGTVGFTGVLGSARSAGNGVDTAIGLLLLLGACGKSAQLPLQSWLLDAMEGPTPVSALIHAATMVTAGVYLIVRSNPVFAYSPVAQLTVASVGAATLLFGGIIGSAKDDIKKSLAGSTMSQIGYMVLGAGLGPAGYVFAIAQLLAHGFFKACLFLDAGSTMHALHDEVSMRRYGALAKVMPVTFGTFAVAYLSIIGIPPFSAFYTKDGIIEAAFAKGGTAGMVLGAAAVVGAGITSFYMTRMLLMTFAGKARWQAAAASAPAGTAGEHGTAAAPHPHESPAVMIWPMVLLAIGAGGAGAFFIAGGRLASFLSPVTGPIPSSGVITTSGLVSLAMVIIGALIAAYIYGWNEVPAVAPPGRWPTIAARKDLYGDAFNEAFLMRPGQWLTRLSVYFDNRGIDGIVSGTAAAIGGSSGRLRRVQTGFVRSYALSMFFGGALLVAALLAVRL
jgi:NADH-quinone oxidoreductase subunit L